MIHVMIIGAGFSGTTLALASLRQQPAFRITLVDSQLPGRGVAYGTDNPDHWLNVPARGMSADPAAPDDFLHWWAQQRGQDADNLRLDFAPRREYARYLAKKLAEKVAAADNDAITVMPQQAIAIDRRAGGWRVTLDNQQTLDSDHVVLAMGNALPQPTAYGFADPWHLPVLDDPMAPVFILGTGLTMVDTVMSLNQVGHRGPVMALSRRGLVPHAHDLDSLSQPPLTPPADIVGQSPRQIIAWVRQTARQSGDWRRAIDALRRLTPAIWQGWHDDQKSQFLRHLQSRWDIHRHRMAPAIADKVKDWRQSGRLNIVAGKVVRANPLPGLGPEGWQIDWRSRGAVDVAHFSARLAVDCSGRRTAPRAGQGSPLLDGLLHDRLVRPDAWGLGFDSDGQNRLLGADGAVVPGLWAVGPLVRGAAWENTAVPELRQEAVTVADRLSDAPLRQHEPAA